MDSKHNRTISSMWMFLFLATLCTISHSFVGGLLSLDEHSFGPKPKGTIKTINALAVGDIIDCVDIYKQPAFDNPRIKDLKMPPSYLFGNKSASQPRFIQAWNKFGECPKGTVPIRRTPNNNVTIHPKYSNAPNNHEYASVIQTFNRSNGGKAYFNAWNPRVMTNEFSLSQIWVVSGHGELLQTAEAGWLVYPNLFHDARTRLFIFYSLDNYRIMCHMFLCEEGFVQTDFGVTIGGAVEEPLSVYDGDQTGFNLSLSRSVEGDWWLGVGERPVGYFPRSLFTTLADGADAVSFGGEIINFAAGGHHTRTTMGSGQFSDELFRRACYISHIKVKKPGSFEWVEPNLRVHLVTRPKCYDLTFGPPRTIFGSHFYFGGPGFSQQCQ